MTFDCSQNGLHNLTLKVKRAMFENVKMPCKTVNLFLKTLSCLFRHVKLLWDGKGGRGV